MTVGEVPASVNTVMNVVLIDVIIGSPTLLSIKTSFHTLEHNKNYEAEYENHPSIVLNFFFDRMY